MPKNIVVLSDGTGQNGGKGRDTNVYKLYRMLEDRTENQVVYYDEGIGTETQIVSGSMFGAGFDKNILQCYRFIFDHYQSKDKIFLFGFSRGAATVRSLASFIHYFGILPAARPELIEQAYKIYANRQSSSDKREKMYEGFAPLKMINRWISRLNLAWRYDLDDEENGESGKFVRLHPNQWVQIEFLGVWDTVPALGLVASDMLDAMLDLFPALKHNYHNFQLRKSVKRACHAIAIDDQRKWFWPTVWKETQENSDRKKKIQELIRLKMDAKQDTERKAKHQESIEHLKMQLKEAAEAGNQQKVEQVWFGGSHTDVGGGFWEAGFSDIALEWMVQKAFEQGLRLFFDSRKYWNFCIAPDATDDFHDPRAGVGKVYARGERSQIWKDAIKTFGPPRIHTSVLERARSYFRASQQSEEVERYRPWILQQDFSAEIDEMRNSMASNPAVLENALELDPQDLENWLSLHYEKWCLVEHYRSEYENWLYENYGRESMKEYCDEQKKAAANTTNQELPSLKEWRALDSNSFKTWKLKNQDKYTYVQWIQGDLELLKQWVKDAADDRPYLVERTRDVVFDPDGNALTLCEPDRKSVEEMIPDGRKVFVMRDYFSEYLPPEPERIKMLRNRARKLDHARLKEKDRSMRKKLLLNPTEDLFLFRLDRDQKRWEEIKKRREAEKTP